jgi:hypothetical protein
MSDAFAQFEKRLDHLERKHRELAKGYVAKINPDGLITVEPKSKRTGFAIKLVLMVVVGLVFFKSITLAIIGPVTYDERIAALAEGNAFEQLCAWVMQSEPLSQAVAVFLANTF